MEVAAPTPAMDFDFSGATNSPFLSAPSSPQRFGQYFLSAPTSPSRFSGFNPDFDYFSTLNGDSSSTSSIPFGWVEKPGTPKSSNMATEDQNDDDSFAFYVSHESEKSSRSAEELFDSGKIKPLKSPASLEVEEFKFPVSPNLSSKQPKSPKKMIRDAFSPKRNNDSVHFAVAADRTQNESEQLRRGRDRTPASVIPSSNSGRRATRSQSPSHYACDEGQNSKQQINKDESSSKSSKKWRLRDFLLFRSASEGRGTSKDPLRKYSVLYKKPEEAKASSFRSSENSTTTLALRKKGPVSAHEFHYAMKRAESQDLKKKTFLPYKRGILGRLAGFGSFSR